MLTDYLALIAAVSAVFALLYLAWRVWRYHRAHFWRSRKVPVLLLICFVMLLVWWRGRSLGYGVDFPLGGMTYGEIDLAAGRLACSVTRCYGEAFIIQRESHVWGGSEAQLAADHLPPTKPVFYARVVGEDARFWAPFAFHRDFDPGRSSYTNIEIPYWFLLLPFAAFLAWGMRKRQVDKNAHEEEKSSHH
jgi:hypothetical protein